MTKNKTKKHNLIDIFYILLILFFVVLLVVIPENSILSFYQGIIIWATKILPALLPFFILTNLLSYTSFTDTIGRFLSPITKKLYGVGGVAGYVYIMSILSGYPVGAKLTSDLYKSNKISKGQAHTIASFTSTSGPLFIIGTVGIGFFHSQKIGLIVLISHFAGAILNGLVYKNRKENNTSILSFNKDTQNILNDSMLNSIKSIMAVGGFIAIFYMALELLLSIQAFNIPIIILEKIGINRNITISILSGLIEVTTGALSLSQCGLNTNTICLLLSFLISFGGLSIHAQAYCFLKDFGMNYGKFFLQKITHAILSTSVTFLIILFF